MSPHRQPLVSIVIPLHNHARVIGASIDSCLDQTYPHVEIIVVDDGSSDRSLDVARTYEPRVRVIRGARRVGSCLARNVGLSYAAGEFVLFHDSDDVLFPDRVRHDLDVLARDPSVDIIVSINRWFTDGRPLAYDARPVCRRERRMLRHMADVAGAIDRSLATLLRYGGPQHSCVLYRTALVRDLGGYADQTEPYADRELLFRALCRRATAALNPRVTCGWRLSDSPDRMTAALRDDDYARRLGLAARYAALLDAAGLLQDRTLRQALIAHVAGHVYTYAARRQRMDVARDALRLVARLSEGRANGHAFPDGGIAIR